MPSLKGSTPTSILNKIKNRLNSQNSQYLDVIENFMRHWAAIHPNLFRIHWLPIKDVKPINPLMAVLVLSWSVQNELKGHMNVIQT